MWVNREIGAYRVGLLVVYASFLLMIVPAVLAAHFHFEAHFWHLGLWSLASIVIVPKSVLGLLLVTGRKTNFWFGLSRIVVKVFPKTVARYRDGLAASKLSGGASVFEAYLKESMWLFVGLFPVAQYYI